MKRVAFICVENSCRSQMAHAFVVMEGKGIVDVYSAGSRPSGVVNAKAIAVMAELGYDLSTQPSQSLAHLPQGLFDFVITMGCGDACPFVPALERRDWGIPDPKHMSMEDFRGIRNVIHEKVRALLTEIQSDKSQ